MFTAEGSGETVTMAAAQQQLDAIVDGNLEAQIGDYWIINNEKWVIQAKDICYDYEDNAAILADVKHHMTIIPERQ